MEYLPYAHPAMAALSLVLAFIVFRSGFAQRKQRLRHLPAAPGRLKLHLRLGPWATGLLCLSAAEGLGSAVLLRKWAPLATAHGWLGLTSAVLFVAMWRLGLQLVAGHKHLAGRHGLLGLVALFAACMTGVLGIALLP